MADEINNMTQEQLLAARDRYMSEENRNISLVRNTGNRSEKLCNMIVVTINSGDEIAMTVITISDKKYDCAHVGFIFGIPQEKSFCEIFAKIDNFMNGIQEN